MTPVAPPGSTVTLRRETGARHTVKAVDNLPTVNGKTPATPAQDRRKYRIQALNSSSETLAEAEHCLYTRENPKRF